MVVPRGGEEEDDDDDEEEEEVVWAREKRVTHRTRQRRAADAATAATAWFEGLAALYASFQQPEGRRWADARFSEAAAGGVL